MATSFKQKFIDYLKSLEAPPTVKPLLKSAIERLEDPGRDIPHTEKEKTNVSVFIAGLFTHFPGMKTPGNKAKTEKFSAHLEPEKKPGKSNNPSKSKS